MPYDCGNCWDVGEIVDYSNGRGGRTIACACRKGQR